MVTTFVHSAGNRTKGLWRFLEEASRADKVGGVGAPLTQENDVFLLGQGPDLCSPIVL